MENHSAYQTTTLSMKISCCEVCPKKLKKKLLKMHGVESVAIDTKNNLVFVTGTINPTTLLNDVAKLGKAVQLVQNDGHNNTKNYVETGRKTKKTHMNCCCGRGHQQRHASKKKVEEEHKCETYDFPKIDEKVCADMYCLSHVEKFHHMTDEVLAHNFLPFYNWIGPYGSGPYGGGSGYGYGYGGGSYPYPCVPEPRLGPHHPFGFQHRH